MLFDKALSTFHVTFIKIINITNVYYICVLSCYLSNAVAALDSLSVCQLVCEAVTQVSKKVRK